MQNDSKYEYYFAGPLNLERQTKQASTLMGTKIPLDSCEFDALEMLAVREDEFLTFEQLYTNIWEDECSQDEAKAKLNRLMIRINEAGKGFMRMEYTPEAGYRFQTRWGHNWHTKESAIDIIPSKKESKRERFDKPLKKHKRTAKTLIAGLAAAASVVLIATFGLNSPEAGGGEYLYIFDVPVPLAAAQDLENNIVFPSAGGITLYINSYDAAIELYNPESNAYLFIFELVLTDTGEVLYKSELSPPGTFIDTVVLARALEEGIHRAALNIRAYDPESLAAIETVSEEVVVNVIVGD